MNMINSTNEKNFLILNPDTFWDLNYLECIKQMDELFANSKIKNILLVVNKKLSFDKQLSGDFNLQNNQLTKNNTCNKILFSSVVPNIYRKIDKIFRKKNFKIFEIHVVK